MRTIGALVGTLLCIGLLYVCSPVYQASQVLDVQVTTAQRGDIYQRVVTTGTIRANLVRKVTAPTTLKVLRCEVELGQEVQEGQVLLVAATYESDLKNAVSGELQAALETAVSGNTQLENALQELLGSAEKNIVQGELSGNQIVVRSPIAGTVTQLNARVESDLLAGAVCAEITDLNDLYADLEIPEGSAEKIETGMVCSMTGEAFSKTYTGKITEISPVAQTVGSLTGASSTIVSAQAAINKPDGLRPGYTVRAMVFTDMHEDTVLVPYEALIKDESGQEQVFVLKNGILEKRAVTIGMEQLDTVEILSGVRAGETLILDPEEDWKEGQQAKEIAADAKH